MSLEKEEKNRKPKESPRKVQIETKGLLEQLAHKIALEYGIDVSKVKELLRSKTETKLSSLKEMININTGEVVDASELQNVLKGARDVIEKASREEIEFLK